MGCGNSPEEEVIYSLQFRAILESMNLTPTDGNGVSNSDCEQFGLDNYEQVDDVLKFIYYRENNMEELIHPLYKNDEYIRLIDSYNEQGVDKVMSLHQSSEFKRQPSPICPTKDKLGL
jgi:NH3-dependent NAD+ synthetase